MVVLVATGGTIASRSSSDGVQVALSGADLLARAGADPSTVRVVDLARGPSWSLGPDDVLAVARTVVGAAAAGVGVVITHGTDTVEETAFLTWLVGGAEASERGRIVFTAAMRHDDHPDADGPANLREALALAAAGGGPGPVVHVAGQSHHARWVTKSDTTAPDTFRSVGGEGVPPPPPPHGTAVEHRVAQVQAHSGVDAEVVDWHLTRGARGLVLEGTGAGNLTAGLMGAVERPVGAGVPVVVTSRCWTGRVAPTYGGPGGGRWLADAGVVSGGDLPTHKARVALSVALGADPSPEAVAAWFARLVGEVG